jgi:plastocyanin
VTRAVVLVAGLVVAALLGAGDGAAVDAQNPRLFGSVGPEFDISLRDAQGNPVMKVDPGTYAIEVEDRSDLHTFHLSGPGVDESTDSTFTGKVTWTVTFRDGNYLFRCDVHPSTMRGTFVAGNPPATAPPPTTNRPPSNLITAKTRLVLTSGPAEVITLKTAAGGAVKRLKVGTYTVTVRDRGRIHSAHVRAPGFDRRTSPLTYTGTQTWKVKAAKAGRLSFFCDPHRITGMRGSATIVP